MLAYHCPQCNMPLFKYEGKVICPACKKEAEIIGEGKDAVVKLKDDDSAEKIPKETEVTEVSDVRIETTDVEMALKQTIQILIRRLMDVSKEEKISIIKEYVDVIKNLIELLEKVRCLKL